ncbi:MAG: hypothetical protein ACRENK_16385 [Gemmatimonadaceae bacterium]
MSLKRFDNSKRVAWRAVVERATEGVRQRRAGRLRARGKELATRERQKYVSAVMAGELSGGSPVRRGDRYLKAMPRVHPWHAARALGCEEVFRRVEDCGDDFAAVARCTSSSCRRARQSNPEAGVQRIPLGCSSRLFCDDCKLRIASRFRREFNAARLGILWAARLQGRTSRWRPKYGPEARFSERLITLTAPHVGTPAERVAWMFKAWPAFLKKLNAYQRGQVGAGPRRVDGEQQEPVHGVRCTKGKKRGDGELTSIPVDRDGKPIEWVGELVHSVRVFEWTPAADGNGHPHFHVWHFGVYIPQKLLAAWWLEAWAEVSGNAGYLRGRALDAFAGFCRAISTGSVTVAALFHREATGTLLVDVRRVLGDDVTGAEGEKTHVANELIKYLTKDWGADPEIFGELFGELVERRARQTSSGFAAFSVPLIRICEACGCIHESETGFRWVIEPKREEPDPRDSLVRDRAPPNYGSGGEPTDHEIVAEIFDEAYRQRTAPERKRILAKIFAVVDGV